MIGGIATLVLSLLSVVILMVRFRASRGEERQQLRWLASVAALSLVAFVAAFVTSAGLGPYETSFSQRCRVDRLVGLHRMGSTRSDRDRVAPVSPVGPGRRRAQDRGRRHRRRVDHGAGTRGAHVRRGRLRVARSRTRRRASSSRGSPSASPSGRSASSPNASPTRRVRRPRDAVRRADRVLRSDVRDLFDRRRPAPHGRQS